MDNNNRGLPDLRLNFIDRGINYLFPQWGLARTKARAFTLGIKEGARAFDAASRSRRTSGWDARSTGPNKEAEGAIVTLRDRSRELGRNNPYAKRAIQAIATNTIGLGIRATPFGGTVAENKRMKEKFAEWADSVDCDYDGSLNFYGLQHLAMRTIAQSGEVLIRRRKVSKSIPLQLQVLECDFLDDSKNSPSLLDGQRSGGEYDIQGIRFDAKGKRVGYWVYSIHPGEGGVMESKLIPADEIAHIYCKERPGQERGIPFGTSAALSLHDFSDYEQAQLIRQKIAACFAIFVTDTDQNTAGLKANKGKAGAELERIEPGAIEYLPAGKQVTMANPPGVQNYHEYSTAMLRKVAVGYGLTYEIISGDLSGVNFSSGRMGWIEFHRLVSEWQSLMIIPQGCNKIWGWFNEAAIIGGIISKSIGCRWTPPRREMIDPVKEIKGMSEAVRNGFSTWHETVRQMGFDPEVVFEELKMEQEKMKAAGLTPESNAFFDPARIKAAATSAAGKAPGATTAKKPSKSKKEGENTSKT